MNLYAYCENDPVNKWDYLGLENLSNESAPLNDFFIRPIEDALNSRPYPFDMSDVIEIRFRCLYKNSYKDYESFGYKIAPAKISCDGGTLQILTIPRFSPPPEVKIASKGNKSGGNVSAIPNIYVPAGKDIPSELWGKPTASNYKYNQFITVNRYIYNKATFTAGRFVYARRLGNDKKLKSWAIVDSNTNLYKIWDSGHPTEVLPKDDIIVEIPNVKCKEKFTCQVGSKGIGYAYIIGVEIK